MIISISTITTFLLLDEKLKGGFYRKESVKSNQRAVASTTAGLAGGRLWENVFLCLTITSQGLRKKREKVEEEPIGLKPRCWIFSHHHPESITSHGQVHKPWSMSNDNLPVLPRKPDGPQMPSPPWLHHGLPLERLGRPLPHHPPLLRFWLLSILSYVSNSWEQFAWIKI